MIKYFAPLSFSALILAALSISTASAQDPGPFYLAREAAPINASVLEARLNQVIATENSVRAEKNLPPLSRDTPLVASRAAYAGPTHLGPATSTPWVYMGGPALHLGSDFILPEPQLARYNQEIRVYRFRGAELLAVQPFREFAVSRLEGEEVILTRIFFSPSPREADIWRRRDWAKLLEKSAEQNPDVARSYAHLSGRPIHFGVGGLWAPVTDRPHVQVRVPKGVLLDLAKRGLVEIGLTGPSEIPAEIIVLEGAWPQLVQQPMEFVEAK